MHPYATDSNERKTIPFVLAGLALAAAWGLSWLLRALNITIPWWLDAPSAFAFYVFLYGLFERKLWRLPILRKLGVIQVPHLEGRWEGHITTSFDEHATRHNVEVQIDQSWAELMVRLNGKDSKSHSLTASLSTVGPEGPILSYQYRNEPLPSAKETMQIHYGTARLTLSDQGTLRG